MIHKDPRYKDVYKFGKIEVGNNCFLGYRCIILQNVKIGDNSIVAAGAVVNKSIPSGEVWGGIPAKYIMKTSEYAEKCLNSRLPYDVNELHTNQKNEILRVVNE